MAPDQSAKKTQSRKNLTRMKGHVFEEKVLTLPEEPQCRSYSEDVRRPIVFTLRMEYIRSVGTITLFLSVAAH